MTLRIEPDLDESAGGYAWIVAPPGQLTSAEARVAVFNSYRERWLGATAGPAIPVGAPNWQSDRHAFGPYPVERHPEGHRLRIGPEIVNQLEEYSQLDLHVGEVSDSVTWPDNVLPRVRAAVLGKIISADRPATTSGQTNLMGKISEPTAPADEPAFEEPPALPEEGATPKRKSLLPVMSLGALVAAVAVAVLVYFLSDRASAPVGDPAQVATSVAPDTRIADDTCSLEALMQMAGGFRAVEGALAGCSSETSADTVLYLIEEAAAREDAQALALFGALYDEAADEPLLSTFGELRLAEDLGVAARYYERAVAAGSGSAAERLTSVCDRLSAREDTLSRGAHDDHCD